MNCLICLNLINETIWFFCIWFMKLSDSSACDSWNDLIHLHLFYEALSHLCLIHLHLIRKTVCHLNIIHETVWSIWIWSTKLSDSPVPDSWNFLIHLFDQWNWVICMWFIKLFIWPVSDSQNPFIHLHLIKKLWLIFHLNLVI